MATRLSARERRRQIVAAAIASLATVGYGRTSFQRIAEQAELSSTGLVSYHFRTRELLMRAVVEQVWATAFAAIRPRMDRQSSPAGTLREFVRASVEFYLTHPTELAALQEVRSHLRAADGRPHYDETQFDDELAELTELFARARAAGEMSPGDPRIAAVSLRGVLNATRTEFLRHPDQDAAAYADQLVRFLDLATGATT